METKKRAVACLVGGIFGMLIALAAKQTFEWLWVTTGMMAGASLAYLCYDLRQVFEKIPVAWEMTKIGSSATISWFRKPHPLFYSSIVVWVVAFYAIRSFLPILYPDPEIGYGVKIIISIFVSLEMAVFFFLALVILLQNAYKRKKVFFNDLLNCLGPKSEVEIKQKRLQGNPLTYKNFFALVGKELSWTISRALIVVLKELSWAISRALIVVLKELSWAISRALIVAPQVILQVFRFFLYDFWAFLIKFFWTLIKLIHSRGRIASAFYSALAVLISCLIWGKSAKTPAEYAFTVTAAGFIGAALGLVSCQISQKVGLVPKSK